MEQAQRPYPRPDRDSAPFWEGQRRHELLFRRCTECGSFRYPMTLLCLACRSFEFEWAASAGRGTVYSYSVVHHQTHPAFAVPYTIVLVEMEEGPRIVARLRASEGTAVSIGMPVRVEWEDLPEQPLLVFMPDG